MAVGVRSLRKLLRFCAWVTRSPQPASGRNPRWAQGTHVTFTDSVSGKAEDYDFCVSGSTLSFYRLDPNGIALTMILTK